DHGWTRIEPIASKLQNKILRDLSEETRKQYLMLLHWSESGNHTDPFDLEAKSHVRLGTSLVPTDSLLQDAYAKHKIRINSIDSELSATENLKWDKFIKYCIDNEHKCKSNDEKFVSALIRMISGLSRLPGRIMTEEFLVKRIR